MKIVLSMKDPRLRASPRQSGKGVFLNGHLSSAGAPAFIVPDGERGSNPGIISE